MEKKMISLLLEPDLLDKVRQLAKEKGTTVSHEIRQAIRKQLK